MPRWARRRTTTPPSRAAGLVMTDGAAPEAGVAPDALQAGPGGVDDGYAVTAAGEASRVADAAPGEACAAADPAAGEGGPADGGPADGGLADGGPGEAGPADAAPGDAVDAAAGADDPSPAVRAAWVAAVGRLRTRAAVADVLVRITDGDPAGVPQRLCEQLMSGWGLRGAMAVAFTGTRALSVVGADGVLGDPAVHDRFGARDTVARLHDQLARGAALVHRDALPPLPPGLVTGIAPISTPTRLVGALLVAAPEGDDREVARATTLALVSELAETGGAVLSGPLEHIRGDAARRARIQRLLVPTAFTPHFQPIMELGSNRTIGFEALTRWHDRSGPADVLAEAHALGLGADTEFSLAAVATEHARGLPPDAYLALNFSASTILARPDIELLLPKDRTVVIEITENERVDDHEALRRALARLGPNVHVAVDDAGASYASLRHIVIVRPRCVKLDIYWITDLEGDPARQAVLAGLVHLSNKLGCYLVAEGIERQSELLALRQLGITHGQGTLLGRPRPASAYAPQPVLS